MGRGRSKVTQKTSSTRVSNTGLPALQGTPKQIQWANEIRENIIEDINYGIETIDKDRDDTFYRLVGKGMQKLTNEQKGFPNLSLVHKLVNGTSSSDGDDFANSVNGKVDRKKTTEQAIADGKKTVQQAKAKAKAAAESALKSQTSAEFYIDTFKTLYNATAYMETYEIQRGR